MTKKDNSKFATYETMKGLVTVYLPEVIAVEQFTDEVDQMGETAGGIITTKREVKRTTLHMIDKFSIPTIAEFDKVVADWNRAKEAT